MRSIQLSVLAGLLGLILTSCQTTGTDLREESQDLASSADTWIPLCDGATLEGWVARGKATWKVVDGVIVGQSEGGHGHIYAPPELTDLEVKGLFRVSSQGRNANSGLYFRANPPQDNLDGYPNGYEAQICNGGDAFTGWLWKPGTPTGKASSLLSKDGEWFSMRARAVGNQIQIWVNGELVTTHEDDDYEKGYFAIQCHNPGMTIEAKGLYYRDLGERQ